MFKRLSQNTLILLFNNGGTALLAFGLAVLVGRNLGESGLGQYAAVMAWVLPLTLLADLGASTLITRAVAQNPHLAASYIAPTLRLRWLFGGALVGVVWLFAPWLVGDAANALRIAAPLILIDSIFGVYTAVWRAWQRMLPILFLNLGYLGLQVAGVALLGGRGLAWVMLVIVGADIVQLAAAWLWWQKSKSAVRDGVALNWHTIFWQAAPFALAGVLAALQARLLFLLLEALTSNQVLGWYAAASRFIEAAKMPPFALFGALLPALVGAGGGQRRLFRLTSTALVVYAVLATLLLTLWGGWLLRGSFGAAFAPAADMLRVLAWGVVPSVLRHQWMLLRYANGEERAVNRVFAMVLPVQLLLGLILIPPYGGSGAALALLLTESIFICWLWRAQGVGVVLLVLLALAALLAQHSAFDGLYGQDAFAYYNYGLDFREALATLRPPAASFWPLGFPALLAGFFALFGATPQAAQVLVLGLGALAVGVMFVFVRDLLLLVGWRRTEARIAGAGAALILLGCGQFVQSSLVIMADVPALLWALLSGWWVVRAKKSGGGWLVMASLALAMAGITRWLYLLLALPWGVFYLAGGRVHWRGVVWAILVGGALVLAQLAHSQQNTKQFTNHDLLQSWSPANAFQRSFDHEDGVFHFEHTISQFYARAATSPYYINPLFLPLVGLGVLAALWRRDWLVLLLLVGWVLLMFGFLAGIQRQNVRFALAFFPPIAAFAGMGLGVLWGVMDRAPAFGFAGRGFGVLAVGVALLTSYAAGSHALDQIAQRKEKDLAAVEWARQHIPETEADVLTLELWLIMQHYEPSLGAVQIYYETPQSLERLRSASRPTYVLLNRWGLNNQWVGKSPWIAYSWLNDKLGLVFVGHYGNYHLLKVNTGTP